MLASGVVARGIVVERTPDSMVLQTKPSDGHILLLKRGNSWHAGNTKDKFIDSDGTAWNANPIGTAASDGGPTAVLGRSIVGINKIKRTAIFLRTKAGDKWTFIPAPEKNAQSSARFSSIYAHNGTSYRIVSTPSTDQSATDDLIAFFGEVGSRPVPADSADPIRKALVHMGIHGPADWKQHGERIIGQLRSGTGTDYAKIPAALLHEIKSMTNPRAEEFPFAIAIKSTAALTPRKISNWGNFAAGQISDYHPADLAFLKVTPKGSFIPATMGELRAFFDGTLGRQKPLVKFSDLARPSALEIVQSVDELKWDTALIAKAKQAVSTLRLAATDKLVVAYDACGNVEARPLHMEGVQEGHPTTTQWQAWLTELPLLTFFQSDAFAHSGKKNNASWGRHATEAPQMTKMGFMPGGYNKYTGLRRLAHESLGHGTERQLPLMQAMLALSAYLDAAEGTNFMERNYQTGPWEQHTTNLEAYMEDSAKYFKEHPYHAQLLMTVLQSDRPTPQAFNNLGLYTMLRTAMGLEKAPIS